MALRKGHCYTPIKRAYTRKSKVKSKSYIKTIPPLKVAKFIMGDVHGYNEGKYKFSVSFILHDDIQIRDNSMEAARQIILRHLEADIKGNFCMIIPAYPHHILRENKMITGAGADRMQTGMAHSFGQSVGVAAQVYANKSLFTVFCNKNDTAAIRNILHLARPKLPGKKSVIVAEIK
jgi:large subunit ribosomal protein L10e